MEKLKDKLLTVLKKIHKEKEEESVVIDIWCHLGHAYITQVDEGERKIHFNFAPTRRARCQCFSFGGWLYAGYVDSGLTRLFKGWIALSTSQINTQHQQIGCKTVTCPVESSIHPLNNRTQKYKTLDIYIYICKVKRIKQIESHQSVSQSVSQSNHIVSVGNTRVAKDYSNKSKKARKTYTGFYLYRFYAGCEPADVIDWLIDWLMTDWLINWCSTSLFIFMRFSTSLSL